MSAIVQAGYWGSAVSEPTSGSIGNAETGILFSRDDAQLGTTVVMVPNQQGTNFSWFKNLGLNVLVTSTTTISNRRISLANAPTSGLTIWFLGTGTYSDPTANNKPGDNGTSNGATPSGYTKITTSTQVWDSTGVATSSTGRNGNFCQVVLGADQGYSSNVGPNMPLPTLILTYDEA